jgi:serine/threonine-protein kinase
LWSSGWPISSSYPLLIAASGLWSRENIVWKITALSAIAYSALLFNFFVRNETAVLPLSANIVMGSIFITGFVVSQQVKRLWAISSYYEKRVGSR